MISIEPNKPAPAGPGSKPTILIATTNQGKLDEYRVFLGDLPAEIVDLRSVGLGDMDVVEDGLTFHDNALIKARAYHDAAHLITLADDSGIAVDALGGAPGVYSARYAPSVAERNAKLLEAMAGVPDEQRTAHFVCVVAVVTPDGLTLMAEGKVDGRVAHAPRGTHGHGYDPVFVFADGRTMAELPVDEKNVMSHRGRAMARLRPLLECLLTMSH